MNVYVDSSVLLRIVLGQQDALAVWSNIDVAVSSELIRVECLRTIDRARIRFQLDDRTVSERRFAVIETLEAMTLIPVGSRVLERASDPFPTLIGSLDAIHLASALLAQAELGQMAFATHDRELGMAARAMGFDVEGVVLEP